MLPLRKICAIINIGFVNLMVGLYIFWYCPNVEEFYGIFFFKQGHGAESLRDT